MYTDSANMRLLADWPISDSVRNLQFGYGFVNLRDFIDEATALTAFQFNCTAAG